MLRDGVLTMPEIANFSVLYKLETWPPVTFRSSRERRRSMRDAAVERDGRVVRVVAGVVVNQPLATPV